MRRFAPSFPSGAAFEEYARLVAGFAFVYLVLERLAAWTGSLYGEDGALIAAAVLLAALIAERLLFGLRFTQGWRSLGFGLPSPTGLAAALIAGAFLACTLPLFVFFTEAPLVLRPDWQAVAIGVFLQGGIAEETLWRGYLFRRLRLRLDFARAAAISMGFITVQHLLLLWQLPLPVALAALVVALATSYPLAHLFELGRGTIWGVATLHAIIQGGLKVALVPEEHLLTMQFAWMAAACIVPWVVFLLRRPSPPPA